MSYSDTKGVSSRQFRDYLNDDESMTAVGSGTLVENAATENVSIGLTDRRLLAVAPDGGFDVIGYDRIVAIRSQPDSALTFHENSHWLLKTVGSITAIVALLTVIVLASTVVAPVLLFLAVVGTTVAEYIRRDDADLERPSLNAAVGTLSEGVDAFERVQPDKDHAANVAPQPRILWVSSGLVALLALAGLLVFSTISLFVLTLITIGGIALVDYACRHHDSEEPSIVRKHGRDVRIHLIDGRTVHLRIDSDESIDKKFSQLVYGVDSKRGEIQRSFV